MEHAKIADLSRKGVFGGFAKIHQMFEDYREGSEELDAQPEHEEKMMPFAPGLIIIGAIFAGTAYVINKMSQ